MPSVEDFYPFSLERVGLPPVSDALRYYRPKWSTVNSFFGGWTGRRVSTKKAF